MTNDEKDTGASQAPEELQADVERNRADLGETVGALADKARGVSSVKGAVGNVTAQARQTFQTARDKAGPATQQAQEKAREFATKARDTATSPDVQAEARRSGTAVAAGAGAVLLTVWALRRRRARRLSRWERTAQTVQRTGAQARDRLRDKAAELGANVRDSDFAAQAQERGQAAAAELAARTRHAAETPEGKHRLQGAAAAAAVLLALGCMRRSRAARRDTVRSDRR
jgi:hypothetical protein